jgi:hypothetical protein
MPLGRGNVAGRVWDYHSAAADMQNYHSYNKDGSDGG